MMKSKVELIYCVMVVATAVLAGVMKCTASATCSRCDDLVDRYIPDDEPYGRPCK